MRDLIFISLEHWDEIWRRNQFVCAELARRYPAQRILFVTPACDVSNAVRRRDLSAARPRAPWSPEGLPNITVIQPTKLLPNTLGWGHKLNTALARRTIRTALRRIGIGSPAGASGGHAPLLWINDHALVGLVGTLGEAGVVYDITDDWTSLSQPAFVLDRIRQQDAELCRRADAVIVCSERLLEMKRVLSDRLHLIPNGVDAGHYSAVLDGTGPLPPAAAGWKKPVYGYTGSVHPDRVDVELVREVALRVDGTLVLVGPDMLPPAAKDRLALPNVVVHGKVPYADLPGLMRGFDVCIVPHVLSPFTESLNPIKLWEYLAAGKPIVSTPVAGFRDFGQFVRLATGAGAFADALRQAASEPPSQALARRAEAARHSWSSRVDQVEVVLESAIRRDSPARSPVSSAAPIHPSATSSMR